jgi:ATP/ADP translocase
LAPGEGRRVLTLFVYYFAVVAVAVTGKSARDAYFLNRYDKSLLPLMFVVVAVAVAIAVAIHTWLSRRMSPAALVGTTHGLFALSLLLMELRIEGWVIPCLYVWMEIIAVLMGLQFWMLASDVFEPRQAKRLFGVIGAGGSLGAIVAGAGLEPFSRSFGSARILSLTAGFIAVAWVMSRIGGREVRAEAPRRGRAEPIPPSRWRLDPYLASIAVVIGMSAVVTTLIDYQFKMIASDSVPGEHGLVGFFGEFYALSGVAALVVQLFVTSRVLSRLGVLAGLLILPTLLLVGSTGILVSPFLISGVLAKFADQTFKFTIQNSSLELLWLPVSAERRRFAKPLISGTVKSAVEGLAGLVTFVIVHLIALRYLSLLALGAILAWLLAVFRVRHGYARALMSAIQTGRLDLDELTLDVRDPAMVATIDKTLVEGDDVQRLFALDLIAELAPAPWTGTLRRLLADGSPDVRRRVLSVAWEEDSIVTDDVLRDAILEGGDLATEAALIAGRRGAGSLLPMLEEMMDSGDADRRAAGALAVLSMSTGPVARARSVVEAMLDGADERDRVRVLEKIDGTPGVLSVERLLRFLGDPSPATRNTALALVRDGTDRACIPAVIANLEHPATYPEAKRALATYGPALVLGHLGVALDDPRSSRDLESAVARVLKNYPEPDGVHLLVRLLKREDFDVYGEAVESLLAVARVRPLGAETLDRLRIEMRQTARSIYALNRVLHLLPPNGHGFLLRDDLHTEIRRRVPAVLRLGVMRVPESPVEAYLDAVQSQHKQRLPFVVEFFDHLLVGEERTIVTALIEPLTVAQRDEVARRYFDDLPRSLDAELETTVYSGNEWQSAIALHYLVEAQYRDVLDRLDWNRVPDTAWNRESISRHRLRDEGREVSEQTTMYSTLEKTILLKGVELFEAIPASKLSRVAQIAAEVRLPDAARIFNEGDHGDSLFIVVDGSVRIHRGERDLAVLGKGDCLGEMALLDREPRSADATVTAAAVLLEIPQEGFYEVMAANPEIMNGIIRLLTARLRRANEKLVGK